MPRAARSPRLVGSMDWFQSAKCRGIPVKVEEEDTHLFYPERSNGKVQQAKAICTGHDGMGRCPVVMECLVWAIQNSEFGCWGGCSERERRTLSKVWKSQGEEAFIARAYQIIGVREVRKRGA